MFAVSSLPSQLSAKLDRLYPVMLASANLPFDHGENVEVAEFMNTLNPKYRPPQRTKSTELVAEEARRLRTTAKNALAEASSVAITTDAATTVAQASIQAVTAHFITANWKLVSLVLDMDEMDTSHTAEHLQALLQRTFSTWEIADKVSAATTDNAANILACCNRMVADDIIEEDVRCFCHTLMLAVRHGVDECPGIQAVLLVRPPFACIYHR
jgi:CheY-like chemotaxis protein